MSLQPTLRARSRLHQAGMSLVSLLVAMVVFSLGMIGLASIYALAVPAQSVNQQAFDTAALGNQFWSLLQSNPGLVGSLFGTSPANGTQVQYTAASAGGAPTALKPMLGHVFNTSQLALPGAQVTITAGPAADGSACTASSAATTLCGVRLQIVWTPIAGTQRTQTFNYQVGF